MDKRLAILNVLSFEKETTLHDVNNAVKLSDNDFISCIEYLGVNHYIDGDPKTGNVKLHLIKSVAYYKADRRKRRTKLLIEYGTFLVAITTLVVTILK